MFLGFALLLWSSLAQSSFCKCPWSVWIHSCSFGVCCLRPTPAYVAASVLLLWSSLFQACSSLGLLAQSYFRKCSWSGSVPVPVEFTVSGLLQPRSLAQSCFCKCPWSGSVLAPVEFAVLASFIDLFKEFIHFLFKDLYHIIKVIVRCFSCVLAMLNTKELLW